MNFYDRVILKYVAPDIEPDPKQTAQEAWDEMRTLEDFYYHSSVDRLYDHPSLVPARFEDLKVSYYLRLFEQVASISWEGTLFITVPIFLRAISDMGQTATFFVCCCICFAASTISETLKAVSHEHDLRHTLIRFSLISVLCLLAIEGDI